jgi:hypothetical protein
MEPFSPQDPLTKLLAQARKIEARSNFTQNVVRAARQTPQDRGWLAAVRMRGGKMFRMRLPPDAGRSPPGLPPPSR